MTHHHTNAYPAARLEDGVDPRFTGHLVTDVAEVLTRHGWPPVITGEDFLRLHSALFQMIYQEET